MSNSPSSELLRMLQVAATHDRFTPRKADIGMPTLFDALEAEAA
jgi:hypothetical protein